MQNQPIVLRVITVSLQLKFRCRMRVESKGGPSTREAEPNSKGLYVFDEDLHIMLKGNSIDLNFGLITDKGSHYSGGILKISPADLKQSQISVSRMALTKCIDKEAWCEFQVFFTSTPSTHLSRNEQALLTEGQTLVRQRRPRQLVDIQIAETQSEQSLSIPLTNSALNQRETCLTTRKNCLGQDFNLKTDRIRSKSHLSPNRSVTQRTSPELIECRQKTEQAMEQVEFQSNRAKKIEIRLKHQGNKLKQEQDKRKSLEGSEHNYKLQIMRLKMGKDEGEKELSRKNSRIKELSMEVTKHRECQQMLSQAREQLKCKQSEVNQLRERINIQSRQLIDIKGSTQEELTRLVNDLKRVKNQKDKALKTMKEKEETLQTELRLCTEESNQLKQKISAFQNERERNKKSAVFQSFAKEQTADGDKQSLVLRKQIQYLRSEAEQEIGALMREKESLEKQLSEMREGQQKQNTAYYKLVAEKRSFEIQRTELQTKLSENKKQLDKLKSRCQQQIGRNQVLREENGKLKKKFELLFSEVTKVEEIRQEEFQFSQRQMQNIGQLLRESENRAENFKDELNICRVQMEKIQRSQLITNKELVDLRQREKNLKGQLSRKQTECVQLKGELDALSHKIVQRMQNSSQLTPNFSFLEQQLEDQKLEQLVTMFESQKKQIQADLEREKLKTGELINQIALNKEQIERLSQRENEWKQQQRLWQKETEKNNIEMTQLTKHIKDLDRKLREEEHKTKLTSQRYEKEKKALKIINEKNQAAEAKIKECEEEIETVKSELQIIREEKNSLRGETQSLRAELDYLEGERKKYVKNNEELEFEVRTANDQISLSSIKNRQLLEKQNSENKKHREEVIRYENKLKTLKIQSEKFKESLRKTLTQFIRIDSSQDLSLSKDQKRGLTLTNELLFRLEELLRDIFGQKRDLEERLTQVEKQLSEAREEGILNTNQAQNAETALKEKLQDLVRSYESMKILSEEREEASKKVLEQNSWNINRLQQEIKNLKDLRDHLAEELNLKTQQLETCERTKTEEQQQALQKITTLDNTATELSQQLQNIQGYCFRLEQTIAQVNREHENCQLDKHKLSAETARLHEELDASKIREEQLRKQKIALKQSLTGQQTQLQELRLFNKQLQLQVDSNHKERTQGGTITRILMKEKEELLHQYLQSQKKVAALQNIQFQIKNRVSELELESQDLRLKLTNLKSSNRQLKLSKDSLQSQLREKDQISKQDQQKISSLKLSLQSKDETIESIIAESRKERGKYEQSIASLQISKKNQEDVAARLKKEMQQLSQKEVQNELSLLELSKELQAQRKVNRDIKDHLAINEQRFTEFIQTEKQAQRQIERLNQQNSALRVNIKQMAQEISEKDYTNYELSSQKYQLESQTTEEVNLLHHKAEQQEEEILRYRQLCQEIELKLTECQHLLQLQTTKSQGLEKEKEKLNAVLSSTQQEYEGKEDQIRMLNQQLMQSKSTSKTLRSQLQASQHEGSQKLLQIQEQWGKKEAEVQRLKGENESLRVSVRRLEEKIEYLDKQLQEAVSRSQSQMEKNRKIEFSLKKMKENNINGYWNCEREVKKAIAGGVRALAELGEKKTEQTLRGVEEAVLDVLKRYKQF